MPAEKPSHPSSSPPSPEAPPGAPLAPAGSGADDQSRPDVKVCPVCGSTQLLEIRQKLHCQRCHAIVETCCEGGPG
jgi:ribosomal protein S27AE